MRIPLRYEDAEPDKRALDAVNSYAVSKLTDWILVTFTGPPGTGKTHDACGLLLAKAKKHGARPVFVRASDIPDANIDTQEELLGCRDLIIDDLGTRTTEYAQAKILSLLEKRERHGFLTFVTGNLSRSDGVDQRIKSRLHSGLIMDYSDRPDRRKQGVAAVKV